MLERFYEPAAGNVFLAQQDIRDINIQTMRKQIALVSQDPVLFDFSIRENIAYGFEGSVDDEKVMTIAKQANIDDLILSLPQGLDTNVGRRGGKLSGGQKQRIAIARALFKDPKILLLDEATSALDNESERLVQDALNNLMKDRTTLIIAHRLSTVKNADEIVVMSEGTIVEKGTHSELLQADGLYSSLVRAGSSQ